MIKPNEILVGCYISNMHNIVKVDPRFIRWCYDDNEGFNKANRPIELNTDHLILCDFKEDKHGHYSKGLIDIIPAKDGMYPVVIQLPELSFQKEQRVALNRLKYFHEFQIFVLVITGEMPTKI